MNLHISPFLPQNITGVLKSVLHFAGNYPSQLDSRYSEGYLRHLTVSPNVLAVPFYSFISVFRPTMHGLPN